MTAHDEEVITGPHAWLNWQAKLAGQPARTSPTDEGSVLVQALWTEYTLHSDAPLSGQLAFGPYVLTATVDGDDGEGDGTEVPARATLRSDDHLVDARWALKPPKKSVVDAYVGGGEDFEVAALLSLALDRRIRSRGPVLVGREVDQPQGEPHHRVRSPPVLVSPGIDGPMIPDVSGPADLATAGPLLETYAAMDPEEAVAVVRAASQYADALWLADADPRLAWLKLVGAVETAANHWDSRREDGGQEGPTDRLRRHMPELASILAQCPDGVEDQIAQRLAHLVRATAKFHDFLMAFLPEPPTVRPDDPDDQVEWTPEHLSSAIKTIYGHRSDDVHEGVPFPALLQEPPWHSRGSVRPERFSAHGAWSGGGYWRARDMPMYLHTFAYLVGGALRQWWSAAR